jgi:hypothetical protein
MFGANGRVMSQDFLRVLGGSRFRALTIGRWIRLPEMSNFCCLPGRAGGTPSGGCLGRLCGRHGSYNDVRRGIGLGHDPSGQSDQYRLPHGPRLPCFRSCGRFQGSSPKRQAQCLHHICTRHCYQPHSRQKHPHGKMISINKAAVAGQLCVGSCCSSKALQTIQVR